MKAQQDRDADEADRQRCGMLTNGQTGDDIGRVTGLRGTRNFLHGPVMHRRVIIGDHDDDGCHERGRRATPSTD